MDNPIGDIVIGRFHFKIAAFYFAYIEHGNNKSGKAPLPQCLQFQDSIAAYPSELFRPVFRQ